MGEGESCDVTLLQQDTVTGAHNPRSRRAVVGHSSESVLAVLAEEAAVPIAQALSQPSRPYHADLPLIK